MAQIERRVGKKGVSYILTVSGGKDANGKQIRHRKTFTPPQTWSEARQEKAAWNEASKFEEQIRQGFALDNRQTFSQYAQYVIGLKERAGAKHNTVFSYKSFMPRINAAIGYLKLNEIRPQHLNAFYKNLSEAGIRVGTEKAIAKVDFSILLKEKGWSRSKLAEEASVSPTTVTTICRGQKITYQKAEQVAQVLKMKPAELFRIEKDATPLSPKTVLEYHRFIHTILDQAEREMLVPYNAAAKAVPPKLPQHKADYFQPEQITEILDSLEMEPIKWRTITHLLLVTGCRRGEIAGLKWSKVDLSTGTIRIDTTLLYTPDRGIYENSTKTGDTRFIRLPAETISLLKQYRQWYSELRLMNGDRWQDTGYLFVQDDGRPISPDSIGAWLGKFSKRHGLPHIHAHAFRHTVASVLISNGTDIVTVSKRLGHARTSTTTDIYSHVIQEADAQASECISDVLLQRKRA